MWKVICATALLLVSIEAGANACALPSAASGEPYVTLASWSKRELSMLLSEYMFMHRWMQHSEAVLAGFGHGDQVYGEVLKAGGRFSQEKVAAWRRAYEKSGRRQFRVALGAKVDMAAVDRAVVDWVVQVCLGSDLWSELRIINDCRFVFAAGLVSSDASRATVQPVRFEVRGGRCGQWPRRPLSVKGDTVQCVRSGEGAATLELKTDRAGLARQTLPPLAPPQIPPEPVQKGGLSEPVSEVFSLSRSRDYRLQQLGRGCPRCGLYAADIRPSVPDAVILRATTVSSSGPGWKPCPADLRCGVYEFSPPDNPLVSGCAGLPACRVWRLAETGAEASDVVQLTYQRPEVVCVNCPADADFETARKRWQQARERARARCGVVEDSPAQSIGPGRRN